MIRNVHERVINAPIETLHDAVVEDLFDNAEREATGTVVPRRGPRGCACCAASPVTGSCREQSRAGRVDGEFCLNPSQHRVGSLARSCQVPVSSKKP